MQNPLENKGVLEAVMERFSKFRLPRILDIKKKVDQGDTLADMDITFLEEVLQDTKQYKSFVDQHPEFQELYGKVAHLYDEVTKKALENEKRAG